MPIDIELHGAICDGDFKKAYEVVKTHPDLSKGRDEKKDTILHRMAVYDVVNNAFQPESKSSRKDLNNLVSELIKHDPKILLVQNKKGRTALSLAINPPSGVAKKEMVSYLLKRCPAAVAVQDNEKHTALHHAILSGNFDVINEIMNAFPGALQKKDQLHQIPLATALQLYRNTPSDVRMSVLRQVLDFTVTSNNARDVLTRVKFNGDFYGQDLWKYATDFCIEVGKDLQGKKTFKVNEYLVDFVKYAAASVNYHFFGSGRPGIALNYVMTYAEDNFDQNAYALFKAVIKADIKHEQHRTATLASTNHHVKSTVSVNLRTLKPLIVNRTVITLDEKKKSSSSSTPSMSASTTALQGLSLMKKKNLTVVIPSVTPEEKKAASNSGTKPDSDQSAQQNIELSSFALRRGTGSDSMG